MIFYLNHGLILEQAIADVIHDYIDHYIDFEETFPNFHCSVTNNHPFADLFLHSNRTVADAFPTIVVSTENSSKTNDLMQLPFEKKIVTVTKEDVDNLIALNDKLPGVITLCGNTAREKLNKIFEVKPELYGIFLRQFKTDRISIEIWADNNQLKNELYEHLRIFLTGFFQNILSEKYKYYGINITDTSFSGERSNNFNLDFDVALYGAHITFSVDYSVAQYVIDTDIVEYNENTIVEVVNHVKENKY